MFEELEGRHLLTGNPFGADFDFGTSNSPLSPGFNSVSNTTTFSSAVGSGAGTTFGVDHGTQGALDLTDLDGGDACPIEALRGLDTQLPEAEPSGTVPSAHFSASYVSGGVIYYNVDSVYQRTTNTIRVLLPSSYDPSHVYKVIYVLPVEPGNNAQFGDGLTTVKSLALQDTYNVIFVEPSFSDWPWYADNNSNSAIWQETYFRKVVVPFVEQQYSTSGQATDRLLLGFSKSGYGAVSMILRHPEDFGRVAVWDALLALSDPGIDYGLYLNVLGSRQNFYNNYQVTSLVVSQAHYFQGQPPRIFMNGYNLYRQDLQTVDMLMTNNGLPHVYNSGVYRAHVWSSGWVPELVSQLLSHPWHNDQQPNDVSGDGSVTLVDVLELISFLRNNGSGALPRNGQPPFFDVNGDGAVALDDVLPIVAQLRRTTTSNAEGEPPMALVGPTTSVTASMPREQALLTPQPPILPQIDDACTPLGVFPTSFPLTARPVSTSRASCEGLQSAKYIAAAEWLFAHSGEFSPLSCPVDDVGLKFLTSVVQPISDSGHKGSKTLPNNCVDMFPDDGMKPAPCEVDPKNWTVG